MQRDLMRSLGGGKPWLLMEQSPRAVNWRQRNAAKLPGQMRAWSYQCIGRGADGILFFQWRQAAAGAEKFHAGMVPHGGTDTRCSGRSSSSGRSCACSRVSRAAGHFRARASGDRVRLGLVVGDRAAGVTDRGELHRGCLRPVPGARRGGATVDFVRPTDDLAGYRVVVVPSLFVASDEQLDALDAYAAQWRHSRRRATSRPFSTRICTCARAGISERSARPSGSGSRSSRLRPHRISRRSAAGLLPRWRCAATRSAASRRLRCGASTCAWTTATVDAVFEGGALDGHPAVTHHDRGDGHGLVRRDAARRRSARGAARRHPDVVGRRPHAAGCRTWSSCAAARTSWRSTTRMRR